MNNKVTCCKDCTDRHYNCHAECKTYQDQRGKLYKYPDDEPFREYWSDRNTKIERKKFKYRNR